MTDHSARQDPERRASPVWSAGRKDTVAAILLSAVALVCIFILEARFFGLEINEIRVNDTPVTLYVANGATPAPPVVIAHGFAGSRQMMDQISVSLARQGFLVASLDLPGHGRHPGQLSPDIGSLDGTTAQLAQVVEQVAEDIAKRPDTIGPISFVGHSMATDLVIRAAERRDDVGGIVAISMYSPAVTPTSPSALLVISGAREEHLRGAGLDAAQLVDPAASEGETVTRNGVTRRTAVAPFVGHVGVLFAPTSLLETTAWLREATEVGQIAPLDTSGWIAGVLLTTLVLLVWPIAKMLPQRDTAPMLPLSWRGFLICVTLPIPIALIVAALPTFGIVGHAAFGTLGVIFGAWGVVQITVLRRCGIRYQAPDAIGTVGYLALALVFALALDRYGAAFLPVGDRAVVLLGLLLGTVPFAIADTALVHNASFLRRILTRLSFLAVLSAAMALIPSQLGLAFTTLPVLVLFFVVYGTMARWVAA
ncbi:MAG: alpha/beta fold hydrolase, partial [Pseudomonadota bacterium]